MNLHAVPSAEQLGVESAGARKARLSGGTREPSVHTHHNQNLGTFSGWLMVGYAEAIGENMDIIILPLFRVSPAR